MEKQKNIIKNEGVQLIKFKALKAQFLPFLAKSKSYPINLKSFSKATLSHHIQRSYRKTCLVTKDQNLERIKRKLENECCFLKMKKKNMENRLQNNIHIKYILKQLSENQEGLLQIAKNLRWEND